MSRYNHTENEDYTGFKNEFQAHYAAMESAFWAHPDHHVCRCHGSGWVLSEVDTFHKCPYHNGPHPEDCFYEEALSDLKPTTPPPPRKTVPVDDFDDIPF